MNNYNIVIVTGTSNVCKPGYYGIACQLNCSASCISTTCGFSDGYCDLCPDGFYDQQCNTSCPIGCMSCTNATNCSKCHDGWFGCSCESQCFENCKACTSISHCYECRSGWMNTTCNTSCPEICAGDRSCNIVTGECLHGWRPPHRVDTFIHAASKCPFKLCIIFVQICSVVKVQYVDTKND